jgi:hypothetical protein
MSSTSESGTPALAANRVEECRDCERETRHEVRVEIQTETPGSSFSGEESEAVVAQEPPHEILDVERDADPDEVREAFRRRVQSAHPDHGGSEAEFRRVKDAKEAMLGE